MHCSSRNSLLVGLSTSSSWVNTMWGAITWSTPSLLAGDGSCRCCWIVQRGAVSCPALSNPHLKLLRTDCYESCPYHTHASVPFPSGSYSAPSSFISCRCTSSSPTLTQLQYQLMLDKVLSVLVLLDQDQFVALTTGLSNSSPAPLLLLACRIVCFTTVVACVSPFGSPGWSTVWAGGEHAP